MDTKKLDKWADLLLDTGKRNNLINFKDTRTSTVEVLLPSSDVLFEKVDGTVSFEVFDPKIVEEDDDTEESCAPEQLQIGTPEEPSEPEQLQIGTPEESSEPEQLQIEVSEKADTSGGKAAFLAQYSGKIKRQNQILLYNAATNPLTAVKTLIRRRGSSLKKPVSMLRTWRLVLSIGKKAPPRTMFFARPFCLYRFGWNKRQR